MPEISRFYGISIYIYYKEHQPPHFHAMYGDFEAQFTIPNFDYYRGNLPIRAEKLVREWAAMHSKELQTVWNQAQKYQVLSKIAPLQ
ncbi:MAG: DUF4160 domain-containing protein [bacterium]